MVTKMKKLRIGTVCVAAILAGSIAGANANGLGPSAYNWSGWYVGGQVGYEFGETRHAFTNGAPGGDTQPDGLVGGGHAGILFQHDMLVFGIEGDIEASDVDGTYQNPAGATSSGRTNIDLQGSARARVGFATDRFLPYLTAGVSIADVDFRGGPAGGPCCGFSETAVGITAGAGLEFAFTDFISARVEYRYTNYGRESGPLPPTFPGVRMAVNLETHAVRGGFSIKLGSLLP